MARQRGSALAEVAVVVSFTLIMLFGILQFVLLGYYQLASDAAVFFGAHQYVLGYTSGADKTGLKPLLPAVVDPTALNFTGAIPTGFTTDEPVDFNITATTLRDGGVSIVFPQSLQASLVTPIKGLFTLIPAMNNVPVSSGTVEPYYQQASGYYQAQGLAYNNPSTYLNNLTNPLGTVASTLDQNTPPYYAAQHFMTFCDNNPSTPTANNAFGFNCTGTDVGIGIAEYLDNSNYVNSGGLGVQTSSQQVFQAMSCHQRIFTAMLSAFPAGVAAGDLVQSQGFYQGNAGNAYTWPAIFHQNGATAADYDGYSGFIFSDPASGRKFPAHYANYADGTPQGPWPSGNGQGGASLATVYSWDQVHIVPAPTYAFNPLNGCAAGEPGN